MRKIINNFTEHNRKDRSDCENQQFLQDYLILEDLKKNIQEVFKRLKTIQKSSRHF